MTSKRKEDDKKSYNSSNKMKKQINSENKTKSRKRRNSSNKKIIKNLYGKRQPSKSTIKKSSKSRSKSSRS
jgi:hypothetical protein